MQTLNTLSANSLTLRRYLIVICSSACRIKSAELVSARVVVSPPDRIDASIPRIAKTIVNAYQLNIKSVALREYFL